MLINQAKSHNIKLKGIPFIQTVSVDFQLPEQAPTWIFFSSKNGVKHFLTRYQPHQSVKLGALGQATADVIKSFGYSPKFIGDSNSPEETARTFQSNLAISDFCWFPSAKVSRESIQQFIPPSQFCTIIVYQTNPISIELDERPDIIVFTSPSNVDAFLSSNKLISYQKIIAIGSTTANHLSQLGIECDTAPDYSQEGLYQAIYNYR